MLLGPLLLVGGGNAKYLTLPGKLRSWLLLYSVNQRLPSGPSVMLLGSLVAVGRANSVILPVGVMRPIWLSESEPSVNQRLPSGPTVMPPGPLLVVGKANSVMLPD